MLTKEGAKTLDTIGVQIILLVFIIGAGFAAWILWNNAAAPDALKNGVIGLASLLPLLASILPYLNVEKLESTFNFGLVYDSLNKEFSSGQSGNPYQTAYLDMFSNLSLSEAHAKIETASDPLVLLGLGLDIIEKGIVEVLIVPAPIHWESQWLQPYNLTVGDSVILSLDKVGERFRHNTLINTPDVVLSSYLSLPPRSVLSAWQGRFSRFVKVSNPYGELTISMFNHHGHAGAIWGVQERAKHYFTLNFTVSVSFVPTRFKNYSPKMPPYKSWYTHISQRLLEFDLKNIEEKIERFRTRAAIDKLSK